jgi:hypothetical protein
MVAVIVVVPLAALVAVPLVIVATVAFEDAQFTWPVRLCVVPSLKLPVAVNCCELPRGIVAELGEIVIDERTALVIVSDAVPTCPANTAVIVAFPGVTPRAKPLLQLTVSLTVATAAGVDVHETDRVRSCVLPSANNPIAENWTPVWFAMVALAGVIRMPVSVEDCTTKLAEPLTAPCWAKIVAAPGDWPVASPPTAMLAMLLAEEDQVTALVSVWVVPSLYVPIAVYCEVDAGARTAVAGDTEIDDSVAELTVSAAEPDTVFSVAWIEVVPAAAPVAVPELFTVAAAVLLDAHVTSRVMTWVVESLNVPVAANAHRLPGAIVRSVGVTEIDDMDAFVTVRVTDLVADPRLAVMVVVPGVILLAEPLLFTVATPVLDELHETWPVRLCVLPSV